MSDITVFIKLISSCRGKSFRKEFEHLEDVCGLIPDSVHIMDLTDTATKTTRQAIMKTFGSSKTCRIFCFSKQGRHQVHRSSKPRCTRGNNSDLVEELQTKRASIHHTIKFCRSYNQCYRIRKYIVRNLFRKGSNRNNFYYGTCQNILWYIFTACTHLTVKNAILESFLEINSVLRIMVANCLWNGP